MGSTGRENLSNAQRGQLQAAQEEVAAVTSHWFRAALFPRSRTEGGEVIQSLSDFSISCPSYPEGKVLPAQAGCNPGSSPQLIW